MQVVQLQILLYLNIALGYFWIRFNRGFHAGEKWMVPNLLNLCGNSQHLFQGTVFKRPFHPVPPSSTCMQCLRTVMYGTVNRSLAVVCDRAHTCVIRETQVFFFLYIVNNQKVQPPTVPSLDTRFCCCCQYHAFTLSW